MRVLLWAWLVAASATASCAEVRATPPASERQWAVLYEGVPLEALRTEREALQFALGQITDPLYESAFQRGEYDVVGRYTPGAPYELVTDTAVLSAYRFLPGGDVGRVVLSEAEFPEPYAMKSQIDWLVARESHF